MKQMDKTVEIEITKAELEEKFFKGIQCTAPKGASPTNACSPSHRH